MMIRKVLVLMGVVGIFGLGLVTAMPTQAGSEQAETTRVNLNTATLDQLAAVKAIGPEKAQAIVDYRTKNGPLKAVHDLLMVEGFTVEDVDKILEKATVK